MQNLDNYNQLIKNVDAFIRKYYLNKLIRGSLLFIGLTLLLFISFNVSEYYLYLSKGMRKVLFYSFLLISAISFGFWVLKPFFGYMRLGKVISHEQASTIIGRHFANVKDKLLNILQLKAQLGDSDDALLLASINQKTSDIKLVPFKSAINLKKNKKFLKYALPPLLLLLLILTMAPSVIKDGTKRIINNNEEFEREAPFQFVVENKDNRVIQFDDYIIKVKMTGEVLPDEVFIDVDNYKYRLKKEAQDRFSFTLSNVQKDTDFRLTSGGFHSKEYNIVVLKKPSIVDFKSSLHFPVYTRRKNEVVNNIGDFSVPVGTNISWIFKGQNTSEMKMAFGDDTPSVIEKEGESEFSYKRRILRNQNYKIYLSSKDLKDADSIYYTISVIPDMNPSITVEQFIDSLDDKLIFFAGKMGDDYGITSLTFNYKIRSASGIEGPVKSETLDISKSSTNYEYFWDINKLGIKPGEEIDYYFEVWDNDAVNGHKSSRTSLMSYDMPTEEEVKAEMEQNSEDIKEKLKKSIEEAKKIQEELKKIKEKVLQEKELNWQDKQELQKLLEKQNEMQKDLEQSKQKMDENMKNKDQFSEEMLEKYEKIQELFEEFMDEEMKDLLEQINEMMEEMDKEEMMEKMEEMEMNSEEMEKEMDRTLEMFKQMEVERKIEEQIEKLEELAEKEEKLAEETEKGEKDNEELKEEQEKLQDEFKKMEKELEELQKENKDLENPLNLQDHSEESDEINEDMDDSQEKMDQNENSKASESQKDAAKKMKTMAGNMKMEMQAGEEEQQEEDMKALRQLLENLVDLSFDQEDLIYDFNNVEQTTPLYVELVEKEYKIKNDFKMVEDSLHELSKRVYQIETFVTEKVGEIKENLTDGLSELEERNVPQANIHQQDIMRNFNDLALMLSEVMAQMQQSMSGGMPGSQNCNKPGGSGEGSGGKVPKDKLGKSQMSLNKSLQKMKEGMGGGNPASSKEFAKMAAQQAALRKAMEEAKRRKMEKGEGGVKEMQELIDQMNKTETDLVNKRLTNEMMKRQQEILTKLLKSEKATRQREYDNKRKAESAQQVQRPKPPALEEYLKKREAEIDVYKSVSPNLAPFYKYLVEEYYKRLKE